MRSNILSCIGRLEYVLDTQRNTTSEWDEIVAQSE
jgi:hypothetical protein